MVFKRRSRISAPTGRDSIAQGALALGRVADKIVQPQRGEIPLQGELLRQQIGFVLQLMVLMFLPLVIGWQLFFGFPLIYMPLCVLLAIAVFLVGHALRKP